MVLLLSPDPLTPFWIQSFDGGKIEINAHIFSLLEGDKKEQAQFDYTVTLGDVHDMESVLGLSAQITLSDKQDSQRFKQVLKELQHAQSDMEAGKLHDALSELLKATDELQAIEEKEAIKALRIIIDQQIRELEMTINKGEE